MSFGIFTACFGESYAKWLPDWEATVKAMRPQPDEIAIVGDDYARAAWGGLGRFVLAPEYGVPKYRQAASYNRLLREMTSDWIMHVGVDDLVFPELLETMRPLFADADVVACDVSCERKDVLVRFRRNRPTAEALLTPTMGGQALDACAAYRRSFWERAPYDEEILGGSDVALWIGFAKLGARFAYTAKPGVRYRLHSDSLWHKRTAENIRAVRRALNERRGDTVSFDYRGRTFQFMFDRFDDYLAQVLRGAKTFYEVDLLEDVRRRLEGQDPGGMAIDVGAHIGNHSVYFAAVCGLGVKAIEPSERARYMLAGNLMANNVAHEVQIIAAAAGARKGRCIIRPGNEHNSGTGSTIRADGETPMITLDSLNVRNVRVIKIDVEHGEQAVIEGATDLIARNKPLVYVESKDPHSQRLMDLNMSRLGYEKIGRFGRSPTWGYAPRPPSEVGKISVAIMAHPSRKRFVDTILERLDEPPTVVWDQVNNRWDTGRRSLLAFDPEATHHVVIQDDAIICRNLVAGVREALKEHPDSPVSLYFGRGRPHGPEFDRASNVAEQRRVSWIVWHELCWGVGLCFPTRLIEPMVRWCDVNNRVQNYDRRLSLWLEKEKIPTYYTVPSLVDHRPVEESPSLVPGRIGRLRKAHRFIGAEATASGLDWRTPVLAVGSF